MKEIDVSELEHILKDLQGEVQIDGTIDMQAAVTGEYIEGTNPYLGFHYSGQMSISRNRSSGNEYKISSTGNPKNFTAYFSSENLQLTSGKDRHDMGWLIIGVDKASQIKFEYLRSIKY